MCKAVIDWQPINDISGEEWSGESTPIRNGTRPEQEEVNYWTKVLMAQPLFVKMIMILKYGNFYNKSNRGRCI